MVGEGALPSDDELLACWSTMVLVRRAEERLAAEFVAGNIPGAVHLYIGQEAVAAAVCAHLDERDLITSTHRGHGHFLAKGGDLDAMFAEIWGRSDGICRGMGGSMHVADVSRGILGANGIVAGGMAIAAGAALGAQLDGDGKVAVCFFGDGAANQGVLMETLNVAALWHLPLVFVCENNQFSEFTPSREITVGKVSDRAKPFGIPVVEVDGNDVESMWSAAAAAIGRARDGGGPTFVEAHTYRIHGHMEREKFILGDGGYRDDAEVEEWRLRDPIAIGRERILVRGGADEQTLDRIDSDATDRVHAAVARAQSAAPPDPDLPRKLMFSGREV